MAIYPRAKHGAFWLFYVNQRTFFDKGIWQNYCNVSIIEIGDVHKIIILCTSPIYTSNYKLISDLSVWPKVRISSSQFVGIRLGWGKSGESPHNAISEFRLTQSQPLVGKGASSVETSIRDFGQIVKMLQLD